MAIYLNFINQYRESLLKVINSFNFYIFYIVNFCGLLIDKINLMLLGQSTLLERYTLPIAMMYKI